MKAVIEKDGESINQFLEQEYKNDWNNNSLKFRRTEIDTVYDEDWELYLYDDNGQLIVNANFYLPKDKAYVIIARVHYRERNLNNQDKVDALKQLKQYFFSPINLKYRSGAIFLDIISSNIDDSIAEELGFYNSENTTSNSQMYLVSLNRFPVLLNESFLDQIPDSVNAEDRSNIIERYRLLKERHNQWLQYRKRNLIEAKETLEEYIKKENIRMIKAKKEEIIHLEAILGEGADINR